MAMFIPARNLRKGAKCCQLLLLFPSRASRMSKGQSSSFGSFVDGASRVQVLKFSSDSKSEKPEKMPSVNAIASPTKSVLKYTKVVSHAFAPSKGSTKAAGYDLKSAFDYTIPARGKEIVDTGIKIELPEGCYGRIAPRSGLAAKNFIDVGAGVIDEDYRGVVKVILFNHSDVPFDVKKGDRIAQLICEKIYYPEIEETKELSDTVRGEGGFGSTGTN